MYLPSSSSAEYHATSSITQPCSTLRYDVSTKPNSLTRAYVESDAMSPMFEPCALAREPAGPERGQPALVGDLGQRVRLVHELQELRRAEVFLDDRGHR